MTVFRDPAHVPNIGPRERQKRRTFGMVSTGVAVLLAGGLFALGLSRWWRAVLFIPLWLGAQGILQARAKT